MRRLPLGLLILAVARLGAQQPLDSVPIPLNPIVVSATRLPTPASALPEEVTVLSGAALEAAGVRTVADALRGVPGADLSQTGSFGGQTSLFLRGGESDFVKVLVDGVPVNAPGGFYDFANLPTANIDRIEVVQGPASVLYGSDAVTGVVQIFTRDGGGARRADLSVQGGTYGNRDWDAETAGGVGVVHYSLGATQFHSDGVYAFNNQYANTAESAVLRFAPGAATDATFTARYDDNTYHFPTDGAGVPVDHYQYDTGSGPTLGLDLGHRFSPRVETRLLLGMNAAAAGFNEVPDSANFSTLLETEDRERRGDADVRTNVAVARGSMLTVGAAYDLEYDHSTDVCTAESPSPADCSTPPTDETRHNEGVYAQLVDDSLGPLVATGGVRLEDNESFGTYATYRGGVVYRLKRTRLRATVGTGFREPSFGETFSSAYAVGNPALRPEHSFSAELGVDRALGRVTCTATAFAQRFRDLIDYNPNAPAGEPNYDNIAGATANGVELGLEARAAAGLTVGASYTYLHTDVTSGGFDSTAGATLAPGQPLLRRPANAARGDVQYGVPGRGSATLAATYVGARADQDFSSFPATRVTLPAYTRVDLAADVIVVRPRGTSPGLTATARVENVFDAAYEEVEGYAAPRRTLFVGARLGFGY